MKKIGIIGGMSYESSIHYYERINDQINKECGGLTCAELIIYNVNFAEIRTLMLDNKWDDIAIYLSNIAKILEKAGADYIVIATNTMHKLADFIQSQINIPLIHIADSVALKCLDNNITKVGLLGTRYTMEESFLIDRLKKNGIDAYVPDNEEEIKEIDRIIFDELCKGVIKTDSNNYYVRVINKLKEKYGIKGVILGCTEIEMLVKAEDLDIPMFDTTQSHIDDIVEYSLGRKI